MDSIEAAGTSKDDNSEHFQTRPPEQTRHPEHTRAPEDTRAPGQTPQCPENVMKELNALKFDERVLQCFRFQPEEYRKYSELLWRFTRERNRAQQDQLLVGGRKPMTELELSLRLFQVFLHQEDLRNGLRQFMQPHLRESRILSSLFVKWFNGKQPRRPGWNLEEAIGYVDLLKLLFRNNWHMFDSFMELLEDYLGEKLEMYYAVKRIFQLLQDHPGLFREFDVFLPPGFTCSDFELTEES